MALALFLLMLAIFRTGLSSKPARDAVTAASSLRNALLPEYDRMVAPSEPLMLKYGISPVKIVDVDQKHGIVTVDLWLKQQWVDQRLTWNSSYGVSTLFFTQDMIYIPESELYNGVMTPAIADPTIVVYPAGQMIYMPAVRAEVYCDIPAPPFQNHICPVIIGPWAHDHRQIQLTTFDPVVDHSFVYNTGPSRIEPSTAAITSSAYECCPGLYFDTMTLYLSLSCLEGENPRALNKRAIQPAFTSSDKAKTSVDGTEVGLCERSSLPLIITPFYVLMLFLLPPKSTHRIFLGMMIFLALLLIWTSGVVSRDREGFLLRSIFVTISATCASLVPCVVSALHCITSGAGDDLEAKPTVYKTRFVRMFDLLMLAAVAVVLGVSAAGVFA